MWVGALTPLAATWFTRAALGLGGGQMVRQQQGLLNWAGEKGGTKEILAAGHGPGGFSALATLGTRVSLHARPPPFTRALGEGPRM